ncbi:(3R)-3-hydroxyacyl-CoA dehydrogenase-like isoform X2 [Haemaphysalis longicornis]
MDAGMFLGRLALVTGGASGIGRAACELLAKSGARVAVADVDMDGAKAVASTLTGQGDHKALHVDVGVSASVHAMFEEIRSFSNVPATIVVNSAGVGTEFTSLTDLSENVFDFVLKVNLKGVFLVSRAAARALIEAKERDGAIVNVSSKGAQKPPPGISCYAAAKGGVDAFTRSMAVDLAPHGIRCNSVAPWITETAMAASLPDEFRHAAIQATQVGRAARPEEVAEVVMFLCSPKSSYITGASVNIDGGNL